MKKTYQGTPSKSKQKFAVVGDRQLAVRLPLPLVEVWEELQPKVEHLTGLAGERVELRALGLAAGLRDVCRPESAGGRASAGAHQRRP